MQNFSNTKNYKLSQNSAASLKNACTRLSSSSHSPRRNISLKSTISVLKNVTMCQIRPVILARSFISSLESVFLDSSFTAIILPRYSLKNKLAILAPTSHTRSMRLLPSRKHSLFRCSLRCSYRHTSRTLFKVKFVQRRYLILSQGCQRSNLKKKLNSPKLRLIMRSLFRMCTSGTRQHLKHSLTLYRV